MKLYIPTLLDVDEIALILRDKYMPETAYKGLNYSDENTKNIIASWINNGTLLAIKDNNKIVAFASMVIANTYYEDNEADIEMFYIIPEYRGNGASRLLATGLLEIANVNNCKVMYSACLSGMSELNDKLWCNLFNKFGFEKLGTVMVRSL